MGQREFESSHFAFISFYLFLIVSYNLDITAELMNAFKQWATGFRRGAIADARELVRACVRFMMCDKCASHH